MAVVWYAHASAEWEGLVLLLCSFVRLPRQIATRCTIVQHVLRSCGVLCYAYKVVECPFPTAGLLEGREDDVNCAACGAQPFDGEHTARRAQSFATVLGGDCCIDLDGRHVRLRACVLCLRPPRTWSEDGHGAVELGLIGLGKKCFG
jgi:hypothetical protein